MIRLEGVTKSYDDKVAVRSLDLEIDPGRVFGLIGPNGAGKTTTLAMLSTLSKPDAGRIEIAGYDAVRDVRLVRPRIGYMPDQFGGFRSLSCGEYLRFFGRLHGRHGAALEVDVDGVLELTDLTGMRDEPTSALSTGVRQRLALAKTLLHDPEVLLLDEPASGLDPRARIEIRSLLKELGRMGKTIVVSSHILADLEEICDEVGLIERGSLVWSGSLEKLAGEARSAICRLSVREEQRELARSSLATLERVRVLNETGRHLELELPADLDLGGNRILEALVAARVEVLGFELRRASLEALFLERTKGEIS